MKRKSIIFLIRRPVLFGLLIVAGLLVIGSTVRIVTTFSTGIKDKVIIIDPGHGGQDPGAQYGGIDEKDINLDIALRLYHTLTAKGCKVILTRDKDEDFFLPGFVKGRLAKRAELDHRIATATSNNADLFISIHANSFSKSSTYGMETYYHVNSAPGKALAERIQSKLREVQTDNKRIAKAGNYYVINQNKMPSVIVEVGFLSNSRERSMLKQDSYKDSISTAIANGVEQYFHDFPLGIQSSQPTLAPEAPPPAGAETYRLYYPNETLSDLTFEEQTAASWSNLPVNGKAQAIINELLQNPKHANRPRIFPDSTQLKNLSVQNGIVTLDFSKELRDKFTGGTIEEELLVRSLVWNMCQLSGIHGVRILIEGEFGDSIAGHVILDQTFTTQAVVGKVAIVIDDFGINNPGTQQMLELNIPITAAVMPNLSFSAQESDLLHRQGYEMIIHMPIEAKNGKAEWLGPGALTTELSPEEIKSRLNQSIAQIRYAVGISNHMGSKGTENAKIVKAIVETAKEHDYIILDSKTSESSILAKEAKLAGIRTGIRDVFLDNSADLASIKKQIRVLIEKAKTSEKAIGIGHVGPQGPLTAKALKEMESEFYSQGIQIVPLSELLQSSPAN